MHVGLDAEEVLREDVELGRRDLLPGAVRLARHRDRFEVLRRVPGETSSERRVKRKAREGLGL